MTTRTELIPCPTCGTPRPLVIKSNSDRKSAESRSCLPCGLLKTRMTRYPPDADELVVEFLLAGTPVTATPAERYAAVAYLTERRLTVAAIAARIHCSPRTVERHRAKLAAA